MGSIQAPGPASLSTLLGTTRPRVSTRGTVAVAPVVVPSSSAIHPRHGAFDVVGNARDAIVSAQTGGKYTNADEFLKAVNARMQQGGSSGSGGSTGGSGGSGGGGVPGASLALQLATNPYDRALAQLGLDYKNNTAQTKLQGQRQDADLAALFARLGNYTTGLQKSGAGTYSATGKSLGSNYDQLIAQIADTYKQGAGNTNAELQRLGIQEVAPAALAGLGKDALYQGTQAKTNKQSALTNNTANANLFNSLMTELRGSAAVEGTSQRGRAKQATVDALTALLQNFVKSKNDLSGKRADALLAARLQNVRAAAAAHAAAVKAKAAATPKERKPSGYADALAMLANAAGGTNGQAYTDYKNELDTLLNKKWVTDNRDSRYNANDTNPLAHLQNFWGGTTGTNGRVTYGQKGIDALIAALAVANKRF